MEAPDTAPSAPRSHAWIGRAAFEAGLIVFGLVGALLIDEWRDARARAERVDAALSSIRAELAANEQSTQAAIANHQSVRGVLRESLKSKEPYQRGIMTTPPFSSVAWEAARDAGITPDIDQVTLMALGQAYRSLDRYLDQRTLLLNHAYTNGQDLRLTNPLALAGWLNDLERNARSVSVALHAASRALGATLPAPPPNPETSPTAPATTPDGPRQ
jgi:type II secretory pathway pseudopilin PulG